MRAVAALGVLLSGVLFALPDQKSSLLVEAVEEVNNVDLNLTFDPPWDQSMMSEEALLELGMM